MSERRIAVGGTGRGESGVGRDVIAGKEEEMSGGGRDMRKRVIGRGS
jgi:hypothetical protein